VVAGALLAALSMPGAAQAQPQVIAIVVDRDNPRSDIGVEELRGLFLGKRGEWPDGTRAVPIDMEPGASPRRAFCSTVLRMSEAEYERYWVDQRVRGAGAGPRSVSSPGLVVRLVARVRGAVGYVPLSRVDGTVKVLTVGGVRPGQPGYPLVGNAGWAAPLIEEAVASSSGSAPSVADAAPAAPEPGQVSPPGATRQAAILGRAGPPARDARPTFGS
jgi:hypothetical protein